MAPWSIHLQALIVLTPMAAAKHGLDNIVDRQVRMLYGLPAKPRAGRRFAKFDFMLHRAAWQGDYRPSMAS